MSPSVPAIILPDQATADRWLTQRHGWWGVVAKPIVRMNWYASSVHGRFGGGPVPEWAAFTQPCPTCDRDGYTRTNLGCYRCYDHCHEGHPTTDLRIPCSRLAYHKYLDGCAECVDGFVSVGRVYTTTSRWLPIESNRTAIRDHDHIAICRDGSAFLWQVGNIITDIVLDGFAEPGGWAGQFEVIHRKETDHAE